MNSVRRQNVLCDFHPCGRENLSRMAFDDIPERLRRVRIGAEAHPMFESIVGRPGFAKVGNALLQGS